MVPQQKKKWNQGCVVWRWWHQRQGCNDGGQTNWNLRERKEQCCCCCCCWCWWWCCVGWNQKVNDWGPFLVGENCGGVGWTRLRILLNQEEARLSLYLQPLNLKDQSQNWKKKEREWECWCWCWCALLCYALRSSLQIAAKIGQEDFV